MAVLNEGITVRTCTAADVETIVSLGIKTFRDTFDEFNSPENMMQYINKAFTKKNVEAEMKEPGSVFFVAMDGRKAVGYARIKTSDKPEGLMPGNALEIERLYVHKDYLGKRVGALLMNTCLSYAKKKGFNVVWLGVWEFNERALNFYGKQGFEKFGQHPFVLGDDVQTDFLLQKRIA